MFLSKFIRNTTKAKRKRHEVGKGELKLGYTSKKKFKGGNDGRYKVWFVKRMDKYVYWLLKKGTNRIIVIFIEWFLNWEVGTMAYEHDFERSDATGEEGLLGNHSTGLKIFEEYCEWIDNFLKELGLECNMVRGIGDQHENSDEEIEYLVRDTTTNNFFPNLRDDMWETKYRELEEFHKLHKHCIVSCSSNQQLYYWLHKQIRLYRDEPEKLPVGRKNKLLKLGIRFEPQIDDDESSDDITGTWTTWTVAETNALKEGIRRFGTSSWARIKTEYFPTSRSANLIRVSTLETLY